MKGKSYFQSGISLTSGTSISTVKNGSMYVGGDNVTAVQILTDSDTGTITLVGSAINLNAPIVTINGTTFSCNMTKDINLMAPTSQVKGLTFTCNAGFVQGLTSQGVPTRTSQFTTPFNL